MGHIPGIGDDEFQLTTKDPTAAIRLEIVFVKFFKPSYRIVKVTYQV